MEKPTNTLHNLSAAPDTLQLWHDSLSFTVQFSWECSFSPLSFASQYLL
jgi:hypothetical protein